MKYLFSRFSCARFPFTRFSFMRFSFMRFSFMRFSSLFSPATPPRFLCQSRSRSQNPTWSPALCAFSPVQQLDVCLDIFFLHLYVHDRLAVLVAVGARLRVYLYNKTWLGFLPQWMEGLARNRTPHPRAPLGRIAQRAGEQCPPEIYGITIFVFLQGGLVSSERRRDLHSIF